MSSGLIYAVIVALWAVVLVPIWIRRHDEATESRSVDRFQGAMRTLSRRGESQNLGEGIQARRTATRPVPDHAATELRVMARAASRRRRTSLVLALAGAALTGLAVREVVPVWAGAAPLALLVLFLLSARRTARRARRQEWDARRKTATQARARQRQRAEQAMSSRYRPEYDHPAPELPVDLPAAPARRARPDAAAVAQFYDATAERAWEPVPVPVPTYVSAPRADRQVRVIDLTKPGAWTSGRLSPEEAAAAAAEAEAADVQADAGGRSRAVGSIVTGELLVERRRAVGD